MGESAMVIGEFAKREQVDLIVMATRGQGAMKRPAFGSVTDKVLQAGQAPVLAVPAG
jgi:nucleotide-binding universal stress UspA family protein